MTNLLKAETSALPAYNLRSSLPSQAIERPVNEALPRALLVDDDDPYREALKGELLEAGFDVDDFPDGRDALESLSRFDQFAHALESATFEQRHGRCGYDLVGALELVLGFGVLSRLQ